ncbi:MAG TPA: CGNR zinc finger domain-containing protein [Kofleriaceae bacterium]|nr:CGNR zinc finger domain-containing protein [Kofleriaceae bacterium]
MNAELPDLAALDRFVREHRWTGKRERDDAELESVRELRAMLRRFWKSSEQTIVALVNRVLRDGHACPQLVKHDGWDYHLHSTAPEAPLATRMAVEAAMGMLDLVRTKELSRLRTCEYPSCDDVLVDLSKNRSKRFCGTNCGNRAAVEAYRARRHGLD